jgi:hypothetical protein
VSEILHWDTVKTRKPHKCPLCHRIIPKGDLMVSAAWADGGTVWSEKFCLVCKEYWRSELNSEEIYSDWDTIYGDDFETWDKIRKKLEGYK